MLRSGTYLEVDAETSKFLQTHYLLYHLVIRLDKDTTKVRAVFNTSAKININKSLNECLGI